MRKRPRQQRSSFTVEAILEATTQLLDTEGAALTTNRIAETAGVSVGSIYQYFGDKQAIFDELAARHLAEAEARMVAVLDAHPVQSAAWPTVLREVVAAAVAENSSHGRAHGRLRELASPAVVGDLYTAFAQRLITRLTEYLVADGWTPDDAQADLRLTFPALDAQIHQLAGTGLDEDELTDRIAAYTGGALRSRR
ncbi:MULTISPECIES: TetR/AcrR family transcriptional regulator [Gordonia]|jgi:AcrR family transcriptional regulator|uniref:TetR family transcriptional regulator n=1 Tax=Gordonia alkanivorans CGMCC 6845 TaxID=1423140 RepID=W9DKG1_9ACTN|nr:MULTISPECIES: TetR/AcrR family transcriptional regulator [Gordonia]ETA07175.1 TetR family transcriptional regulator [Gordonia alkanivorans CGMCC 6845]MDH3008382.1 TetR/AcrR family transcriptional regulator [Gordonia alkanivorans]MDH3012429.1 TetR/AcrR family transcriptional regulator [Gordonia alkanivorans]MDH3017228.1 TetR/AcrR family transcriptional regulator [Gordonia alkanivorans]MDH3021775.1 TetR/AcrR family transcriptional regulator [Gordonia alkanivorans]